MDSAGSELKGGREIDLGKMNLYGFFNTDGVEDLPLSDDDESEEERSVEVADKYGEERDSDFYAEDDEGYHEMNPEESAEYYKRVKKSEGFDVPSFPKAISYGTIGPVWNLFSNAAVYRDVYRCAVYALKQYNAEEDKNYKFEKLVKANLCVVSGAMYYITFQAEDQGLEKVGPDGGSIVEFEAQVFLGLPDEQNKMKMDVMKFRQKGSEGTGGIKGCCGCGCNCGCGCGSGSGTSSE